VRFTLIRNLAIPAALIAAATAALSACAGNQSMPAFERSQTNGSTFEHPATSPFCMFPNFYTFDGSCTQAGLQDAGQTIQLQPYQGFTLSLTLPKNNAPYGSTIVLADATGHDDITGKYKGRPFPLYPKPCNAKSCPGKAFLYFEIDFTTNASLDVMGNSSITVVSANGYPGTKGCLFAGLNTKRSKNRLGWSPLIRTTGPKGKKLKFTYNVSSYPPGAAAVAIACD
jgi:hypothetical protein